MYSSKTPSLKDTTLLMYQQKINGLQIALNALARTGFSTLNEYKILNDKLTYLKQAKQNYINNIK